MKIGRLNFSHAVKYEEMTEKLQVRFDFNSINAGRQACMHACMHAWRHTVAGN